MTTAMLASSEATGKLTEALIAAHAKMRGVAKSGKNEYDRYAYANLEDYVRVVSKPLGENGLSLVTSVVEVTPILGRVTKADKVEHAFMVRIVGRLTHKSGEWVEASSYGEGQDRADKGIYKAITGARKYLLASMFGLATTDDPEADEAVGLDKGGNGKPPSAGDKRLWMNSVVKPLRGDGDYAISLQNFTAMACKTVLGRAVKTNADLEAVKQALMANKINLATGEAVTKEAADGVVQ